MKTFEGIASINELMGIYGENRDYFTSYIFNNLSVKDILSIMLILNPDFIEIDNKIYIYNNYLDYDQNDYNRFEQSNNGKEKYINNICITDLFFLKEDYYNKEVLLILGKKILEFWKLKLNSDFQNIKFDFFIYEEGVYDENGVCITFCQK